MKSKNVILAFVLSLLLPGTGHLYTRATVQGILFILLTVVVDLSVRWVATSPGILFMMPYVVIGWRVLVALLAALRARKAEVGGSLLANPIMGVVLIVAINYFSYSMVQEPIGVMEETTMNNNSMAPTLFIREKVAVQKGAEPRLGAIVAVCYPRPFRAEVIDIDRIVGMPGEEIEMRDNVIFVDGKMREPAPEQLIHNITILSEDKEVDPNFWQQYDINGAGPLPTGYLVLTNEETAQRVVDENDWATGYVRRLVPDGTTNDRLFFWAIPGWNENDMGPFVVPKAGMTVTLDTLTRPLYQRAILLEDNGVIWSDEEITQNGKPITEYTFVEDHYFLLSDSRDNGFDSRLWGFVGRPFLLGEVRYITESSNEGRSWTSVVVGE